MAEIGLPTFVIGFISGVLGVAVVLNVLPLIGNYTATAQAAMPAYASILGLITLLAVFGAIAFVAKIFLA